MKIKINRNNICAILFVFSALIMGFAPYQGDSTLSLSGSGLRSIFRILQYFMCAITLIISVFPQLKSFKIKKRSIIQIIPILLYLVMLTFNNYDGDFNASGLLFSIQWIIFAMSSDEIQKITFRYLRNSIFLISVLGIICYFNYLLKLFIPYQEVSYYSLLNPSTYIDYKIIFLFKGANLGNISSILRLCGTFNEPGFFGTICALILCACDLNLKDKKNATILIAGLLSLSLAFVLILIIYLLLKYSKSLKTIIFVALAIIFYISILPNIKTGNTSIDGLIERMTITDNGIAGDNRSKAKLDYIYDYSLKTKPLFGYGNGYLEKQDTGGGNLSYKSYIIQYGVLGSFLFWGTLFLAAIYNNKKNINVLFYVIVFFASIYQRPNIFNLLYQIILFGGILCITENTDIKKKILLKSTAEYK